MIFYVHSLYKINAFSTWPHYCRVVGRHSLTQLACSVIVSVAVAVKHNTLTQTGTHTDLDQRWSPHTWLLLQVITDTVTDDVRIYWNITRTRILTCFLAGASRNDVRIYWNITRTRILTCFLAGESRNDVRIYWNITRTRILTYFLAGESRNVRIYWNITRSRIPTYFLAGASRWWLRGTTTSGWISTTLTLPGLRTTVPPTSPLSCWRRSGGTLRGEVDLLIASSHSVQFSSIQDGIYVLGKAHMRSTLSVRSFLLAEIWWDTQRWGGWGHCF